MSDRTCAIKTDGDTTERHIRLSGEFGDGDSIDVRREIVSVLATTRTVSLVVDLAAVTRMSAECINVLLSGYTFALQRGHGFRIAHARGRIGRALRRPEVSIAPAAVIRMSGRRQAGRLQADSGSRSR